MQPPANLPAPEQQYLSLADLANWIGRDRRDVRELIHAGKLPAGKVRYRRKFPTWTREEAAVCKWILDNLDRFGQQTGQLPPEE